MEELMPESDVVLASNEIACFTTEVHRTVPNLAAAELECRAVCVDPDDSHSNVDEHETPPCALTADTVCSSKQGGLLSADY
jgi:hypothetical protein